MYEIPMLYLCSFSSLDFNEIWYERYAIGGQVMQMCMVIDLKKYATFLRHFSGM
jgi:hypothetical protein